MDVDSRHCMQCAVTYKLEEGIWRLLARERQEATREFVERYEAVRKAEGRVVQDPTDLRALPFRGAPRKRAYEWRIRSQSFRALVRHVLKPLERSRATRLRILDLGSGLGWLAYRLASRGHEVAAIDLVTNDFDGLGVHRHYDGSFLPVQAEFDRLPFAEQAADLIIYNAAFHYATDYRTTLIEAIRVLAPNGLIVIMDSPLYRDHSSGMAMVNARDEAFETKHHLRATAFDNESFITYGRLFQLEAELAVRWRVFEPWRGLRWWIKPWMAMLSGGREPARFALLVGRLE
jgi:SAM-dependent methyltransferase